MKEAIDNEKEQLESRRDLIELIVSGGVTVTEELKKKIKDKIKDENTQKLLFESIKNGENNWILLNLDNQELEKYIGNSFNLRIPIEMCELILNFVVI